MNYRYLLARPCIIASIAFLLPLASWADIKLPAIFTDNMVLQQGMGVPVWGTAMDGEKVTVEFGGKKASTIAKDGKWKVTLSKLAASWEPRVMTVTGNNKVEVKNVLVGEVWIASGQSNMELQMNRSFNPTNDIASSSNPQIRLFTVPKLRTNAPVSDVKASWSLCEPQSVRAFSAVAYYFGRDLQKSLKVPIGLIHTSWGGTPVESWIRNEVMVNNPDYKRDLVDAYPGKFQRFKDDQAKIVAQGTNATARPRNTPQAPWGPAELYNGMIAPIVPFAIRGAIWYQGESNADRAYQYRSLMADMIRNWRNDWNEGDFTFLEVQLAPYDQNRKRSLEEITKTPVNSNWAELREAQNLAMKTLPNVGVAVITDVGEKDDIHPTKKEPVGGRLALAAEKIAYHKKLVYSGPTYKSMKVKGSEAIVSFDNVGGGLEARDGKLTGFAIAGEDQKFVWANAEIQKDKVIVSSPEVAKPVAIRFGWADFPVDNLFNKEGLPASPFRTDDFPMITAPKK